MVPTKSAPPQLNPPEVRSYGLILCASDVPAPLVEGALKSRVTGLLQEHFKLLCASRGIRPTAAAPKARLSKRSYVRAAIRGLFSTWSEAQKDDLINFYVKGPPPKPPDPAELGAINCMDESNKANFSDQHQKLVAQIEALDTEKREAFIRNMYRPCAVRRPTPEHLKHLIPGNGEIPGIYLTERTALKNYQGFYPGSLPCGSHSKTWDGVREQLTREQCLREVVNWLRREHAKVFPSPVELLTLEEAAEAIGRAHEPVAGPAGLPEVSAPPAPGPPPDPPAPPVHEGRGRGGRGGGRGGRGGGRGGRGGSRGGRGGSRGGRGGSRGGRGGRGSSARGRGSVSMPLEVISASDVPMLPAASSSSSGALVVTPDGLLLV